MKHLKLFETESQYNSAKQNLVLPNVSYIKATNDVKFNPLRLDIIKYTASAKLSEITSSSSIGLHINAFSGSSGQLTITKHTFENGVGTIEFSGDVTSIGTYAFDSCSSLTSIEIPSGVTSISSGAFYNCRGLTSINIPSGVTSIGSSAFTYCSSLTSITIPNSVTSIGNSAFNGCKGLTSITIGSGVTSIGVSAFQRCSSLTSIDIPNSVTSIGQGAFDSCSGLTSCTIGSGVTSIGKGAFTSCTSLTSITCNAITAPTIQSNTFRNVKTNGTLYVPIGSSGYDVWMGTGDYYLGSYGWTKVEQ